MPHRCHPVAFHFWNGSGQRSVYAGRFDRWWVKNEWSWSAKLDFHLLNLEAYTVILIDDLPPETRNPPSADMVTGQVWLVYKENGLAPPPSASCPTQVQTCHRQRQIPLFPNHLGELHCPLSPGSRYCLNIITVLHYTSKFQHWASGQFHPWALWGSVAEVLNPCQPLRRGPEKVRDFAQGFKACQARK